MWIYIVFAVAWSIISWFTLSVKIFVLGLDSKKDVFDVRSKWILKVLTKHWTISTKTYLGNYSAHLITKNNWKEYWRLRWTICVCLSRKSPKFIAFGGKNQIKLVELWLLSVTFFHISLLILFSFVTIEFYWNFFKINEKFGIRPLPRWLWLVSKSHARRFQFICPVFDLNPNLCCVALLPHFPNKSIYTHHYDIVGIHCHIWDYYTVHMENDSRNKNCPSNRTHFVRCVCSYRFHRTLYDSGFVSICLDRSYCWNSYRWLSPRAIWIG